MVRTGRALVPSLVSSPVGDTKIAISSEMHAGALSGVTERSQPSGIAVDGVPPSGLSGFAFDGAQVPVSAQSFPTHDGAVMMVTMLTRRTGVNLKGRTATCAIFAFRPRREMSTVLAPRIA